MTVHPPLQRALERVRGLVNDDLVHAVRTVRRRGGVSAMIVVMLALPIGANAAMFSLLDRLLLRPPAGVAEPQRLRRLYVQQRRQAGPVIRDRFVYLEFRQLDTTLTGGAQLAAYTPPDSFQVGVETPRYVRGEFASSELFDLLGMRPALGRFYTAEEDRMGSGANVVVISHAFWQQWFGADRGAVGRTIRVEDEPFVVIGVAPEKFTGPDLGGSDLWLPLATLRQQKIGDRTWYQEWRSERLLRIIARLQPGIDDEWVRIHGTTARRRGGDGEAHPDTTAAILTGPILEALGPSIEPRQDVAIATRLAGVALIVLFVACANVANLLLARAVQRRREIAVRLALGISRRRLVTQLLLEGSLLAAAGGVAGAALGAVAGTGLRAALLPSSHWAGGMFDGRVALFTAAITIATALLSSLVPALQASRAGPMTSLRVGAGEGSAPQAKLRESLIVMQTALTFALLAGAGFFVRSLRNVRAIDVGYDVDRIVTATVDFKDSSCNCRTPFPRGHEPELADGLASVAARLARLPGVEGVALADAAPMQGYSMVRSYPLGRDSMPRPEGQGPALTAVSPTYFSVTGLRVRRGRSFTPADGPGAPPVLIVNETMARRVWPGENALGKCVMFHTPPSPCYTVVGIVTDGNLKSIIEAPAMRYYVPLQQGTRGPLRAERLLVRVPPGRVEWAEARVRAELRATIGGAGEPRVTSMASVLSREWRPWQLGATLFSAFGLCALLIAAAGVYSIVAFAVRQRTHELGVRIALGARRSDVIRLVVADGVRTVGIGTAVGMGFTLIAGRALASLLYQTSPNDVTVLATVAMTLLLVAVAASLLPARWATRADPASVLRTD